MSAKVVGRDVSERQVCGDVRYYDERRPHPSLSIFRLMWLSSELCRSYNDFKDSTKSFFSCSVKPNVLKLS